MEREPRSFDRQPASADASGDRPAADEASMSNGPCSETDGELEAALAEAEADLSAGRVVPHEEVSRWLETLGTSSERPAPREWFE